MFFFSCLFFCSLFNMHILCTTVKKKNIHQCTIWIRHWHPSRSLCVRCQKLVAIIKVLSVCDSATAFYSEFYFACIYLIFLFESVVRQDHILLVTYFLVFVAWFSVPGCVRLCLSLWSPRQGISLKYIYIISLDT